MEPRERAKALGWLSAATSAGVVIGPFIGSAAYNFGRQAPGLVAAVMVLINVFFAWKRLPESPAAQTRSPMGHFVAPEGPSVPPGLFAVLRQPTPPAHPVSL